MKEFIIFLSLLVSLGALATVMDKKTRLQQPKINTQYLPHQQQRMEDTDTDGEPKPLYDEEDDRTSRRLIRRVSPPSNYDSQIED